MAGYIDVQVEQRKVGTVFHNMDKWIEENKQHFTPPVCLKMMSDDQLQLLFVGGPNQRKDYHLQNGEELFYQVKGDMVVKVVENGQHRDVKIREGEIFLLPNRTLHSPQRFSDTCGLVLERKRAPTESDGLIYFVQQDGKPTMQVLFEKYFLVIDLMTQLPAVIGEYFASEEHRTGVPTGKHLVADPPVRFDITRKLPEPFSLRRFVDDAFASSKYGGFKKQLFNLPQQISVADMYFGHYTRHDLREPNGQTFLWVYQGSATVHMQQKVIDMKHNDVYVVPENIKFSLEVHAKSAVLLHTQISDLSK